MRLKAVLNNDKLCEKITSVDSEFRGLSLQFLVFLHLVLRSATGLAI
jgi:hypothetical protein